MAPIRTNSIMALVGTAVLLITPSIATGDTQLFVAVSNI